MRVYLYKDLATSVEAQTPPLSPMKAQSHTLLHSMSLPFFPFILVHSLMSLYCVIILHFLDHFSLPDHLPGVSCLSSLNNYSYVLLSHLYVHPYILHITYILNHFPYSIPFYFSPFFSEIFTLLPSRTPLAHFISIFHSTHLLAHARRPPHM